MYFKVESHAKGSKMGGATSWWQHQNMVHSFLQLCSSYCSRQPSFFSVSLISSPLGRQLYQCRLSIPLILLDREKRQSKNNDIFCFLPFFLVLDTTTFISNKVARLQKRKPNTTKLHFLSENSTLRVKIQIFGYKMSN